MNVLTALSEEQRAHDALRSVDSAFAELLETYDLPEAVDWSRPMRIRQISTPVFDDRGLVGATLMCLGPSRELSADEVTTWIRRLVDAGTRLTHAIGGRVPAKE
jgi:DNA-binding IclR family transcriptional regulator